MDNTTRIEEIKAKIAKGGLTFEDAQGLQMELEELSKPKKEKKESKEVAKVEPVAQVPAVLNRSTIKTWQDALKALPTGLSNTPLNETRIQVEVGFAAQIIRNNNYLQKCSATSIFDAVIYAARIGVTINPAMGLAYLVPRGDKCCLDIGYLGWRATLVSYGAIKHIDGYVVYEDETFTWNPAIGELNHIPTFAKSEQEQKQRKVHGAYAKAILPDGTNVFEFIPAWELEKIKKVSPAASSGFSPYSNWEGEMTRKAPIKRLAKKLLILQDDDRVRAMFEVEKQNDENKPEKKIHQDWTDAEVVE